MAFPDVNETAASARKTRVEMADGLRNVSTPQELELKQANYFSLSYCL
jgi:hypothetical protein